jgi:predicted secreted protein
MRLKFGSSVVQVDDDVAISATVIPILPALSAISIASTATIQEWVRYDSFANTELNLDSESIEIRNSGACSWRSQLKTKLMATISLDGNVESGVTDLGRAVLRQAMMSTESRVAVAILEPDGSWFQAKCLVKSLGRTMPTDAAFTQAISLEVDGQPIYGPATDLVLA